MVNSFFKALQKSLKNVLTIARNHTKTVVVGCATVLFATPFTTLFAAPFVV